MYERRLNILMATVVAAALVLLGRAFTLQVVDRSKWAEAERQLAVRPPELTSTTRGRLLDRRGTVVLAVDVACTDACVDYPAIIDPPDPKWVTATATARLKARYGAEYARGSKTIPAEQRKRLLAEESAQVVKDVRKMWATLATLYRPTDADAAADPRAAFDDARREIVHDVELRRRQQWTNAYRRARDRSANAGGLLRWLGLTAAGGDGGADDGPSDASAPVIEEQQTAHVVLPALDAEGVAQLGRNLERFPGLSLRPSTHRSYPAKDVACHLVGRVGLPTADEVRQTRDADPRTRYEPTDAVGRDGVEAMCEPLLRGVRGRADAGDGTDRSDYVPGQDVRLTIDAALQARAQGLLQHVVEIGRLGDDPRAELTPPGGASMHGACVVIDVRTNEVLALASNPTFDVNDLYTRFAALNDDVVNAPLTDRATSDAVEPGSTVKPLLGTAAVTAGTIGPLQGIECTGNMYLPAVAPDGRVTRVRMQGGRCWVASEYGKWLWDHGHQPDDHHRLPFPHEGHDNNPDGWLTLADALERSCDIYFETVADRMGTNGVCHWYDAWGLGRPTGIGIHEVPGLREDQAMARAGGGAVDEMALRRINCLAGMGEDRTLATPLQMANAMAALARGGVWRRPRLVSADVQAKLDQARPRPANAPPDTVDLHLSPAALEQTRIGMRNVIDYTSAVTGKRTSGTGIMTDWHRPGWLTVAAKTGTADTSPFTYPGRGPDGRPARLRLAAVKRGGPETSTPWYRSETGTAVVHAWYVGYAPAEDPQVAFAVLVEYAGIGGGPAAGPVAAGLLDACVADGYLRPPGSPETSPAPSTAPATQPDAQPN